MIEVDLLVRDGRVVRVTSRGHAAGSPSGGNILCAAVSILLRSFARVIEDAPGMESEGCALEPGVLDLTVRLIGKDNEEWFAGLSDFLMRGLSDLEREYPEELRIYITSVE
ncbi:MAG: ribosomal-processing cysteine protease Prp [Spirochaetia bacterium]